jgi:hypothetical protein
MCACRLLPLLLTKHGTKERHSAQQCLTEFCNGRQAANPLFEAVQARTSSRLTRLFSRAIKHARKPATKPAMWAKLFIRGTKPNMASTAVTRVRRGKVSQ